MAFNRERLKRWRKCAGLSQAAAAEQVNCSQRFWQGLEAGSKQPSMETLDRLMAFTGLGADDLIAQNPQNPRTVAKAKRGSPGADAGRFTTLAPAQEHTGVTGSVAGAAARQY